MTEKPLDPEDPMALVGVVLEGGPDDEALAEMARCFVEEYARMGWSGERILSLFRNPFYRGPHHILRAKGEDFLLGIIKASEEARRQVRSPDGG